MSHLAIRTLALTKVYGRTTVVDAVSLSVRPGEIYGFVGPNGAGKSTTIRMILGLTAPTAGAAHLFGTRVSPGRGPWRRVGYLVDGAHAYPGMTVRENLELVRRLHRVAEPGAVDRMVERLRLTAYRDRKAKVLSLGNLQRLGLARAMLHEPDLLVLDEPANGLDPAGIVELRELLHDLAERRGVAILVSSHILAEIARLATRIGIIDGGRLLAELDAAELHDRVRRRLVVDARDRDAVRRVLTSNGLCPADEGPAGIVLDDPRAVERPDDVASLLAAASVPPTELHVWQEDLEALFLRLLAEERDRLSNRTSALTEGAPA